MRARWIDRWDGPLLGGERPAPEASVGEVLVAVEACGVGLTVLNCIRGDLAGDRSGLPRVPGHEYVGRIAAVGEGVDAGRVGERVVAYFYLFCGACRRCLAGTESLCESLGGYLGVDLDGGYAAYARLPARNAIPIPEEIESAAATAIPDAIATPIHVAALAGIGAGERVAVIGAGGGVGVHMIQVARLRGAEVLALESSAPKREALTRKLDFECLDSADFGAVTLAARWPRGADVVVDLLGSEESLAWSLGAVREAARVVLLTTFPGVAGAVSPRDLVLRQISLLGSRYASRHEVARGAELVASGRIRPIVAEPVEADSVEAVHQELRAGSLLGRGALAWSDDERQRRPRGRGEE